MRDPILQKRLYNKTAEEVEKEYLNQKYKEHGDQLIKAACQKRWSDVKELLEEFKWKRQTLNFCFKEAVIAKKYEIVLLALEKGADVQTTDGNHNNVLFWLAEDNTLTDSYLEAIIQNGVNIDHRNRERQTPLMKAAEKNNVKLFEKLLEYSADVNAYSSSDLTVLYYGRRHSKIVDLIMVSEEYRRDDELDILFRYNYFEWVYNKIEKLSPEHLNRNIKHAIKDDVCMLLFVENGANVNHEIEYIFDGKKYISTPLIYAILHDDIDLACDLIDLYADSNKPSKVLNRYYAHSQGAKTPIQLACEKDSKKLIKRLITAGAKPVWDDPKVQSHKDFIDSIKWDDRNWNYWPFDSQQIFITISMINRSKKNYQHTGLQDLPLELIFMIIKKAV